MTKVAPQLLLLLLLALGLQSASAVQHWAGNLTAAVDCPEAPTTPGDRRTDRSVLRVVSYNVEWLFEGGDSHSPRTPEDAQRHLSAVADVIARVRPDILVMQEVQNCEMVRRLAAQLETRGHPGYKAYLVKGTDTGTMQNVALLTKVDPVVNLRRTTDRATWPLVGNTCGFNGAGGDYGVSKHFATHFRIGGKLVSVLAFHFLAFPTMNQRCAQREAQATVMRRLVDEELRKGHEVILLGDMNDYSDKHTDVEGNQPTSRVMRILRDGVLTGASEWSTKDVAATQFSEVTQRVIQQSRYTSVYNKNSLSQIDHILLTPGLWSNVRNVEIFHGYQPFEVSDHWPVIVDIRTASMETERRPADKLEHIIVW